MPNVTDALISRMNYDTARQNVIAGNIANVSTPGYLPADMSFKSYVDAAQRGGSLQLAQTNGMHMSGSQGAGGGVTLTHDKSYIQHNGNGVRLDQEMLKMQQNNLDYSTMTQLYSANAQMQKIALGRAQ
jgi:flagellar basal-body rod protein FlgB